MSKGSKAGRVEQILYIFIHSLDKKEKENFTKLDKMTAGKAGSDCLKLFEIFNRMDSYDPHWVEKHPLRDAFKNNLPKLRNLLFNALLESLRWRNQRSEKSPLAKQQAELDNIRILMGRGFLPSAQKRMPRLEAEINPGEYPIHTLHLLDLKRRMALREPNWHFKQTFQELADAGQQALASLSLRLKLSLLEGEIRSLGKLSTSSENRKAIYQSYLEHPDLQPEAIPQEFLARAYFVNSRGILLLVTERLDEAYALYSEGMQEWQRYPEKIWDHADLYLSILHHYLHSCIYSSSLEEFPRIRKEIEQQEPGLIPPRHRAKKQRILHLQTLQYYIYFPNKPQPHLETIEQWVLEIEEDTSIQLSRLLAFYNNLWILSLMREDFSRTNFWLQRILNAKTRVVQEDVRFFAKLMSLICMYELEIMDQNQIRSVVRVLKKRFPDPKAARDSWQYQYGIMLIDCCKRLLNAPRDTGATEPLFQKLGDELETLLDKAKVSSPRNEHLVVWWAKGKVEKCSIREKWIEELNK